MHKHELPRFLFIFILGITACIVLSYTSLVSGSYSISLSEVWHTLLRIQPDPELDLVILDFRMPRIIIGALVGLGLGIAGTVIQAISKNGLADPGILGINAGAGLAVVAFMFFFLGNSPLDGFFSAISMPIFGFIGGLLASFLIFGLAWERGRLDPQRLILLGIAVGTGLSAVSLYLSLKMKASDFDLATVWVTGSIWNANWYFIIAIIPWFLLFLPIILFKANLLDLFQLEEENVKGLGVRTERQKLILLLCSVGLVAVCVSVSGSIGFIGLMSPHIAKRLVGLKHKYVLPISGIIGMLLVIVADLIAKTIVLPAEIPVGIVVAIIGVPYFIYLLFKARA